MMTVSAAEFQRSFGRYQNEALKQPLAINSEGRDQLVVLAVEEYHRLKICDRVAFKAEDLADAEVQAITSGGMDPIHDHLNAELE